jgi:hypothetical protein
VNKLALSLLLTAFSQVLALGADLAFSYNYQSVKAKSEDETVTFSFPFKNVSDKAVKLEGVKSTCECTEAGFLGKKKVLAPGESSEVHATMKIGMFSGNDDKKLIVTANGEQYQLSLHVEVPEVVKLSTRHLDWVQGTAPTPQYISIDLDPKAGIKLTEVSLSGKDFIYEPETIKVGQKYRIKVTPKTTSQVSCNPIQIKTDSTIPRYSKYVGMLTVTPVTSNK